MNFRRMDELGKSAELDRIGDHDLSRIHAGSGNGAPMPGLGQGQPLKATPLATWLQNNPLPASTRVEMGSYNHPPAGGYQVSASGGSGQPTQFSVSAHGTQGNNISSISISGANHPGGAQAVNVGFGRKF